MTRDMPTPGITSVAALVYDHSGTARLSIDAKGPRELMNVDDKPEIVSTLMDLPSHLLTTSAMLSLEISRPNPSSQEFRLFL